MKTEMFLMRGMFLMSAAATMLGFAAFLASIH